MKTLLACNLSTKALTTDGSAAWTPPVSAFGESLTLALRFAQGIGAALVEPTLDIRAFKASVGDVDARPASGQWALQIGSGASTGANTTALLSYDVSPENLAAAINALTAVTGTYGTAVVKKADGNWTIIFGSGAAEVPLQARHNTLWPVSFGRVSAYAVDAVWRHEVRLIQAPVAFTDSGERVLPDAPSVTRISAGGSSGGFDYNEKQSLFVPPDFRGTFSLRFGDYARTGELSVADTAETIQAALATAYGDDFKVTNPDFQTFRIEFVNDLAAAVQDLITVEVQSAPPGDFTFTLPLTSAELAVRLRREEEVTLPLEVWLQLADADDNLTWVLAARADLPLRRPVVWPEMALVPGIDFLRPTSPKDYVPFNRESVIVGQKFNRQAVGDGAATVFVFDHGLATEYVFVWVRINAAPGAQLVEGVDYSVEITDADSVTVTALDGAPTSNQWLITVVSAQTVGAFADGLEITIGQVTGLRTELDAIETTLAQFQALIPNVTPGAKAVEGSVLHLDLPAVSELFAIHRMKDLVLDLDAPALHGRRLLAAIHDATVTSLTVLPVPTASAANGNVYQNNTAAAIVVGDGTSVPIGGYFGSDGIGLYQLSRSGTSNSYFPTVLEREPWRIEINEQMLRTGKVLTVKALALLRTAAANTDLKCDLVVEWANILSQSAPVGSAIDITTTGTGTHTLKAKLGNATIGTFTVNTTTNVLTLAAGTVADGDTVTVTTTTTLPAPLAVATDYVVRDSTGSTCKLALLSTAPNLEDLDWQTGTPLLTQRLLISPVATPHAYGVTLSRDASGLSADRTLYGGTVGVAVAPPEANFALRARLIRWDTRNPIARPTGFISLTSSGTADI